MSAPHESLGIETELTDAGGCRRRLQITVSTDDVAREFGETVRRYARAVRMSGFRRGKVPVELVRKRFAHEIQEEVRDHLVRHGLQEAFGRHKVFPLHNPVVEGGPVKEGETYSYSALFEVRPELRVDEYKGVSVSMPEPAIGDDEVEKALTALRERLARFVSVEPRPLVQGDFALLDIEGRDTEGKSKDFKHEGVMVEVGGENNLPEFNQALPGMTVGESKSFTVAYPESFDAPHLAGHTIAYTITVRQIKVKELPAADDELPKDVGRPGTIAELREQIRADLLESHRRNGERQARETILRHLIDRNAVQVPEVMIEDQLNSQIEDIVRQMIVRGVHPQKADVDWNAIREKERPLAEKRVLGMLLLDEIAVKEGIAVDEGELRERIGQEIRAATSHSAEVKKRLDEPETRQALKNQMVREKTLDFLLKNATITH
jgi:trigger factor